MSRILFYLQILCFCLTACMQVNRATEDSPNQDTGLPYTRTAGAKSLALIKEYIAVFPGSRYAYVYGDKFRLDDEHWRDEALIRDGVLLVPNSFISLVVAKHIKPEPGPPYLVERWVSTVTRPKVKGTGAVEVDGRPYNDLITTAEGSGLKARQYPGGLVLIGDSIPPVDAFTASQLEAIVTLFDTPEKFADPDIATKYIPALRNQKAWTEHVKVTAEQLAILNGPETKWPTVPQSDYDFTGFNSKLLGSKVPPPGEYPRILFSAEDVPMLSERIKSSKFGQMSLMEIEYLFSKSWWDPNTSDGQIFQKLASGDLKGLEWDVQPDTPPSDYPHQFKGQKPGIFSSHVAYIPECLTTMAFYCLMTGDDKHGRMAASAIANYYRLREPILDAWSALSDLEFGSSYKRSDGTVARASGSGATTHWRPVHGIMGHMNLGLSLDFSGKWMSDEDKDCMRRIIAKATYGRRAYSQDASVRFRDVNWSTWDLPQFLALLAIEGLEGFDREAYESNCETVRAFLDFGIDDSGVVYESNGKSPGGLQFQMLSMVALARRGENLWGHPHWRKLLQAQVQMTSPTGNVVVNSGTQYAPFSRQPLSYQFVCEMKGFFPDDRTADYLLSQIKPGTTENPDAPHGWNPDEFDAEKYRALLPTLKRLRMPSVTYPGFVHGVLYDSDFKRTSRSELNLPLDFNAPVHGVFSSFSDAGPDAAWMNMMVRPNHYLGAGHHHADAGMFHFSALGVDWFTQSPFSQAYDGRYFNLVQVDGRSEAENMPGTANGYNAAAKYLGAASSKLGGCASADLTYAYSYRWLTQPSQSWSDEAKGMSWEMDPSPEIMRIFAGTARYKMRPWWSNYTYSNFIATSRAPFNPMEYVYRTVGLVRGAHPYGLVIDDLKKDSQSHLYQWTGMLNGGVVTANYEHLKPGQIVLCYRNVDPKAKSSPNPPLPQTLVAGEPLLLVCSLGQVAPDSCEVLTDLGPPDRNGKSSPYDRLSISHRGVDSHYQILLIPFRAGSPLPEVLFEPVACQATVKLEELTDQILLTKGEDSRTKLIVTRAGQKILESH